MSQFKIQRDAVATHRLIIVSNRLPVALKKGDAGNWQVQPSPGGLVTALSPLLSERGGLWVGWPGIVGKAKLDKIIDQVSQDLGYTLNPVSLTEEDINQYYFGFSNEILWPLFHDLQTRCNFDPAYWNAYQSVNRKFASIVAGNSNTEDYIWVHDYQLMLVAKDLRSMEVNNKVGFFLHTPFPPLDILAKLPWRTKILEAMLEYDVIGFQTRRDRNNFIRCIEAMQKGVQADFRRQVSIITTPKREISIGSFPISIDFNDFARQTRSPIVEGAAKQLRDTMPNQRIMLGVDRLDYSKGIPEKLKAFRNALERFNDLRGKITLIQVAVPSRKDILEYQMLRAEIEGLVSEINGIFTQPGWIPVHYMFRSMERTELLAYYLAADIALITSLKDGMNLVAKEYCASNIDKNGVLILSEFAGAANQLYRWSLLVNPYDIEGVAEAIHEAFHMSTEERKWRMQKLRNSVARRDVFWWVESFLRAANT